MKKHFLLMLLMFATLTIWSCSNKEITFISSMPDLKGPAEKALCVFLSVDGNFDEMIPFYIDGGLAGATFDTSITTVEVTPGEHFVTGVLDNQATMRLNFLPGKCYYFQIGALEVPMFDGIRMQLISDSEARSLLAERGSSVKHVRLTPGTILNDFDVQDYQEEVMEYLEWVKDNPEDASEQREYPGY